LASDDITDLLVDEDSEEFSDSLSMIQQKDWLLSVSQLLSKALNVTL